MANGSASSSSGIGVLGLLGVAFVVLKLTGHIDWSWWWVTAPFWGGLALVLTLFLVIGIVWLVVYWLENRNEGRNVS
jgi:Transmembrane Fragile-X-F protein